jgi:hypothetical protein
MSKLFAKVRKDDKDKQADDSNTPHQDFDTISAQMDALILQDYQNMQLEQFERLVIVGMFHVVIVGM